MAYALVKETTVILSIIVSGNFHHVIWSQWKSIFQQLILTCWMDNIWQLWHLCLLCSNCFTVTLESKCIMPFVLVKFCFLFLVNPKAVLSALLVMLVNWKCFIVSNVRSTWHLRDGIWNNSETVLETFHVKILRYVTNYVKHSQSVDGNM